MTEPERYQDAPAQELRERLRCLEGQVADLRMSRRILMTLLEHAQSGRDQEIERLQRENAKLRRQLSLSARYQWRQNSRLAQLEEREEASHGKNSMETP